MVMENKFLNLDIFDSWCSGNSVSIAPELLDSDDNFINGNHEVFDILNEYDLRPDEFIDVVSPKVQAIYNRHFSIFNHPRYWHQDSGKIRFNKIVASPGFSVRFKKLISEYNLHDHKILLFHLIAEFFDYKGKHFEKSLGPQGISEIKNINSELNLLENLKHRIHHFQYRLPYKHNEVEIIISGIPFKFTNQYVIWYHVLQNLLNESKDSKYSTEPVKTDYFDIPYKNDYQRHFQKALIKSLYYFLKEVTDFPFQGFKVPQKLIHFYLDFFILCRLTFYNSKGQKKDPQEVSFDQMKKAIQREID
jgi:hypothetical protein